MRFSQFVDVFVAALYNETQLAGKTAFRISEILERYELTLNPSWRDTLFKDYSFSSRVEARRHLGPVDQQQVSLSPDGLRWVEDELGENVASFLEQNGVHYKALEDAAASDGALFDSDIFDPAIFDTGAPIPSSNWTGLPKSGTLSPEGSQRLIETLKLADNALGLSGASNSEKAQARAYVIAIQALAEAPEPPADLIWQLIERLNSMAGIAALFVAVAGLFS